MSLTTRVFAGFVLVVSAAVLGTALGSVPTALYCFLCEPQSFEDAVAFAVNLGGESDSIGAMTGAIAGAYHGAAAIPERWLDGLERGPKGRDHLERLAELLFAKTFPLPRAGSPV